MSHRDDHRNAAQQSAACTPTLSDEALVEYLLGHASVEQRGLIESWLMGDPQNGERLCGIATSLFELSKSFENQQATSSTASASPAARDSNLSPTHAAARREADGSSRRLVWFAIAASLVGLIVSLKGFQSEDAEPQLAMAWAETLASGSELGEPQGLTNWSSDAASFEDNDKEEPAPLADEFGNLDLEEDAYSLEPPDWLVAAVREMNADPQTDDVLEALP